MLRENMCSIEDFGSLSTSRPVPALFAIYLFTMLKEIEQNCGRCVFSTWT
jgi:hypothetical protein